MVTDLVILSVLLVVASGVVGYLAERGRGQDIPAKPLPQVIDLRPLPEERVRGYRTDWVAAQAAFVDDPDGAVRAADTLVERLMAERGYPPAYSPDGSPQNLSSLSREHAEVLRHCWAAHEIGLADERGLPDTDALRRAMVHYRMVFSALLESAVSP